MTDRLHDDQVDREIRIFLAWQAEEVGGAPTATEVARRIGAGSGAGAGARTLGLRLTPRLVWIVVVGLLGLALVVAAAGAILQVRNRLVEEPGPQGTPSNGWIAYSTRAHGALSGVEGEIFVVREGSEPRLVGGGDGLRTVCPSFSPDGTKLSYVHGNDLVVVGGDPSSSFHQDATFGLLGRVPNGCPVWSPNGQAIAVLTTDGVALLSLDGSRSMLPPPDAERIPHVDTLLAWAPDGNTVALATYNGIWRLGVDGSPAERISTAAASSLSWSPDGSQLAFHELRVQGNGPWLKRVSVLTLGTEALTVRGSGEKPVWSLDGAWIAYQGENGVVVERAGGGDRREVGVGNAYRFGGWSPDGLRVLQMVDVSGVDFAVFSGSAFDGSYTIVDRRIATGSSRNFPDLGDVSWQPLYR